LPPGTVVAISIHFPNDLISRLKGKVVRASEEPLHGISETGRGYKEKGMGIEIIEKDSLYLHFIRSLLSNEGKTYFEQFLFSSGDDKYKNVKSELQETCQLFDAFAIFMGEYSKKDGFRGKVWFEAKVKNNTHYFFTEPVVTFMTANEHEHAQNNRKSTSFPEVGILLMSSSLESSLWKPGKTIIVEGEIDPFSEEVLPGELKFIDYVIESCEFAVDEPININDYISTFWIGSPFLVSFS
jgi:hypothetical protein